MRARLARGMMYIDMDIKQKSYSVAEARNELPGIIHAAERGRPVRITRRGKPVAAIVPIRDFERLTARRPTFSEVYEDWRKTVDLDDLDVGPRHFAALRDRSSGRDVDL